MVERDFQLSLIPLSVVNFRVASDHTPRTKDTTFAHGSLTRECGLWGHFAQRQEVRLQGRPQSVGR